MDPTSLLVGFGTCFVTLGAGFFVGRATNADDLRLEKAKNVSLLERLKVALAQGPAGAAAAQIVVDSALNAAAASLPGDPRQRAGMLLGGAGDDAPGPSAPSGKA